MHSTDRGTEGIARFDGAGGRSRATTNACPRADLVDEGGVHGDGVARVEADARGDFVGPERAVRVLATYRLSAVAVH